MSDRNILRAAIYARVSTDEQAKHGTSLSEQFARCAAKVECLGADVVGYPQDAGVSGGLLEGRPGIQAALQDIATGNADTLIVLDMSRLSRDVEHQAIIRRKLMKE